MKKIILFHNPRWGKSRSSVGILESKKIEFEIIKYLDFPPSRSVLKELSKKLNLRPKDFIRKNEPEFKKNNLLNKLDDDNYLIDIMSKYPKLIERPIIINGDKACIGRPPEKILEII